MQEGGALFPMQSTQPPPGKAGLFAMPPRGKELHNVSMCKPIPHAVNRQRLATIRAGVFRMQSRRRRWRDLQPVNAARPARNDATTPQRIHAARTNTMQPSTCSARQAMQIRPESRCTGLAESPYIHHARHIARAICGHFKRFSGFPVNSRQCSATQSRPPARS